MNVAQHLAATLKTLRQQHGWGLSRLAEETGVSKAILRQIECNESSPTMATLWRITTRLNVPFPAFIVPDINTVPSALDPQQQTMMVTPVFPWDPELRFDHFSTTLTPGALSESTPHKKGMIEHMIVISGALDLCLQGEWHSLQPGEERRFTGGETRVYYSRDIRATHFHSLIHYPREKTVGEPAARQDD